MTYYANTHVRGFTLRYFTFLFTGSETHARADTLVPSSWLHDNVKTVMKPTTLQAVYIVSKTHPPTGSER